MKAFRYRLKPFRVKSVGTLAGAPPGPWLSLSLHLEMHGLPPFSWDAQPLIKTSCFSFHASLLAHGTVQCLVYTMQTEECKALAVVFQRELVGLCGESQSEVAATPHRPLLTHVCHVSYHGDRHLTAETSLAQAL